MGVEPVPDARLREQHLGSLEGRAYEDSWAQAELHDWSDPELPMAGGESVAAVRRRLAAVLSELDPGVPTVLVSHGDAIRSALAHFHLHRGVSRDVLVGQTPEFPTKTSLDTHGQPMTDVPWVDVPNGSITRVDGLLV